MKRAILSISICAAVVVMASSVLADTFGTGENQFTIDFVDISGDASSANGTNISQYSSESSHHKTFTDPGNLRLGTYEITNGQFAKFAINNPLHTGLDVPSNKISWFDAARFVNYLNTSTGHSQAYNFIEGNFAVWESGDTGYDADNPFRNSNAHYFMPTEDEWVKAAYWNGTSLQTYATKNNTPPVEWNPTGSSNSDGQAAGWNYGHAYPNNSFSNDQPWDVTAGYSPKELNGTFDMMGNVWEWLESPWYSGDYLSSSLRSVRGGSFYDNVIHLSSSIRANGNPNNESSGIGFRVASVPEPASVFLFGCGIFGLLRKQPAGKK